VDEDKLLDIKHNIKKEIVVILPITHKRKVKDSSQKIL